MKPDWPRRCKKHVPFVALSHRVNPEAREYERTATTALSAGLMPLVGSYLDRLEGICPATTHLHLFHSAGGMASSRALRDLPWRLPCPVPLPVSSRPAPSRATSGWVYAISFDMGGTTTDVCLIRRRPRRGIE